MQKMSVDDKLGLDRFYADENNPHIVVNPDEDDIREIEKVIRACPAGLYSFEDGRVMFNHEGCLECGTCRVLSGGRLIEKWQYPVGSMGVEFRQG